MNEKRINKRELIFFCFFINKIFFTFCVFFYCKKSLIFFVEMLLILIECCRNLEHENIINDRRVLTIKLIKLLNNLLLKWFRWNNYLKNLFLRKNVRILRFCIVLITNYRWNHHWFYIFISEFIFVNYLKIRNRTMCNNV